MPRSMFLARKAFSLPACGGAWLLAAAGFAAGLTAGALIAPVGASRGVEAPVAAPERPARSAWRGGQVAQMLPTQVLRVIDGDTFEARVRIWPGMDVTTKVRLRGIDAPEMHARCDDERAKALAARDALAQILNQGAVGIAQVGQDKYGGRVDAEVSTASTTDVSAVMLSRGLARRYSGGRRQSWCG
jgi:endonuclease YncB( thermonuclease family)